MLPMIVNSPAAPLLLMLFCLWLCAFVIWRIYWRHSVQPVLQPLQALRKTLPKTATAAPDEAQWQAMAQSCASHEGLQRAWQAYHSQLLIDKAGRWRSQHPASHWFAQDSLSADLSPLGFAVFFLILFSIMAGLGWWLWSANVDFNNWGQILEAMHKPNMGAVGLLFGGIFVSSRLTARRVKAVQQVERQVRALAHELDTCFPLLGVQQFLEQVLQEQASQQIFNAALLANAVRESLSERQDTVVLQAFLDDLRSHLNL